MPTFSATYTTAGGPYNIFDVISGAQTTGVTPRTGSKVSIAPSRNYSRLEIAVDGSVGNAIYLTDDPTADAANLVGLPILAGETRLIGANESNRVVSLASKWFSPDTNNMIVHIDYQ